jgi:signal transduction histidine kinase/ligand-binding sensor domain-containing protein
MNASGTHPNPLRLVCRLGLALLFALDGHSSFGAAAFAPVAADPLMESWRWIHETELDGEGFACMTENKSGLWFGVQKGVIHCDGHQWKRYTTKDGLFDGPVSTLYTTRNGNLWAASEHAAVSNLCVLKGGKWESLLTATHAPPVGVVSVIEAADGAIWASLVSESRQNGNVTESALLRIQDNAITFYGNPTDALVTAVPNARVMARPGAIAGTEWFYLFTDRDGCLWIAADPGTKLARWNPQRGPFDAAAAWQSYDLSDEATIPGQPLLMQTRNGQILLGHGYGSQYLRAYDPGQDRWSVAQTNVGQIHSMWETRDGTVWATSHSRLWTRRADVWQVVDMDTLNLSPGATFLFESSEGDLWFGTQNGNVRRLDYSQQRWISYPGLNFQGNDATGAEWFLHVDGSVVRHQSGSWTRFDVRDGLISDPVTLLCTKQGQVWAAGSHEGLAATAEFAAGRWQRQQHPDLNWAIDYRGVMEHADGSLWFGANSEVTVGKGFRGGLVRCDPASTGTNRWTRLLPPRFPASGASIIAQLPDGQIYYGGMALTEQLATGWQTITNPPELRTFWIDAVAATASGDLWAARGGIGVFGRHDGVWTQYGPGLADLMVSTLLCDRDGTVWAGTPKGISRFDGRSWTPVALASAAISIDRESGTLRQASDGRLWINSASRRWYFRAKNGERFTANTLPAFRAVGYQAGHQIPETRLGLASEKVSQPGNALITWEGYIPWGRTPPDALEFSWRLDQGEWSLFAPDTHKMFLALPSGHHRFEVRARDLDFNVDPTPAQFEFEVVAPVWRQPWFLTLLTVLLGVIAAQTIRVLRRDRRLRTANRALAVEIEEHKATGISLKRRTAELTDANELLQEEVVERQAAEEARMRAQEERDAVEVQLRQTHKLEAVGQLAAGIAHEINTPTQFVGDNTRFVATSFASLQRVLTLYAGLLAAAKTQSISPDQIAALDKAIQDEDLEYLFQEIPTSLSQVLDGVDRIAKIVRAMKEFSHPGSREKDVADLNQAIESTVTVARSEWKYVADLKLELDPTLPPVVCYVGEFNQSILNLIVNASHTIADVVNKNPGTKGLITVSSKRDGDFAEIRVRDTGTGIPEEVRPRLFEPFFTTKAVGKGTGQGLSVVYATCVKRHGGTVTFETEVGKGTTFILRLPLGTQPPVRCRTR